MEFKEGSTEKKLLRSFNELRRMHSKHFKSKNPSIYCKHSEILVLFCLKKNSPDTNEMKVSEISKYLRVTPPTVTQLIKGLEKNGLVERQVDEHDRRAIRIALTEKGEKVRKQAEKEFFESFRDLVRYLGEEESNQLVELLMKVVAYYQQNED